MFDYVELSKRTLGLNWNKFTVDQRKEFVGPFQEHAEGYLYRQDHGIQQRKGEFYERAPADGKYR